MAWEHSGASANILKYRNAGAKPEEWAEVLVDTLEETAGRPGASYRLRPIPHYHVSLYRRGVGCVGREIWTPSRKLNPQAPSPRTIGKIANEIKEKR